MKKFFKHFVAFLTMLIMVLNITISPIAADSTTLVKVTDEIVIQMAENFAKAVKPNTNLYADNPMKFYDESGKAIGYIVNYYDNNRTAGYVIFDSTHESIISEYSFGYNAKNPYEIIIDANNNNRSAYNLSNKKIYKLSPFTYGIIDETNNEFINNYGEHLNVEVSQINIENTRSTITWNDILFDIDTIYDDYTMVEMNNIPEFIAIEQEQIIEETNRYACMVTAFYACAMYYGAVDYMDMFGDYIDLWSMTQTSVTRIEDGVTYGSTDSFNGGAGFVTYCASRGVTLSQYTRNNPSYNFFKNCIDDSEMAVVHCGITVDAEPGSTEETEYSGHSMAVEGYATVRGTSGNTIRTLMVYDGWNTSVRFLNFDYDSYVDMQGTAISR